MKKEKSKRILLVEDDEAILYALEKKFNQAGYEVDLAKDGKVGLDLALKKHPDLIVLDIIMPKMDGLKMLKALRRDKWGNKSLVVVLTNLTDPTRETEAKVLGVKEIWVKTDLMIDEVISRIKAKLSQ